MPDVVSDDELNALAAEYVLGTLDYEERNGAAALAEVDTTFRGIVRVWERRLGDLHLMVEAVEPDPQLWERIKPKVQGVEQVALAIPSHADRAAIVPVAPTVAAPTVAAPTVDVVPTETPAAGAFTPAPSTAPAPDAPAVETPVAVSAAPPADSAATEQTAETATESIATELKPETAGAESPAPAAATVETPAAESKPVDVVPPAIAETELKLAELAALLPVAEQASAAQATAAQSEPLPEDGLHTHAPDLVPRGFVPPAPMSTRGTPAVVEVPVPTASRGWMAAAMMTGLVSLVLAGLIAAWRYFPERLPSPLQAYSVLNLPAAPQQAPAPKARPKLAPFDE